MENEPYQSQRNYQQQAAEYLSQALEYDEQSENHELAIALYKKGIEELEKAINLNIDPNDQRALDLRTKMRKNLAMARERVEILQKLIQTDSNPVIKVHVRPTKVQRPLRPRSIGSAPSSASSNCRSRVMSPAPASASSMRLTSKLKQPPPQTINNRIKELPSTANARKIPTQNQSQRISLKLPNVEPKLVSYILNEVIENRPHVKFDDI
ncbi:unnamed protein product, partial [Rotaria sp. Silwood1]